VTLPADNLVVIDGRVTDEKLAELLALQTELPQLDFKRKLDLAAKEDLVELAKDVGAMQVLGGYIVVGVDDHGVPTGEMDGCDHKLFDESRLVPKLLKYLPEPLVLHARVIERQGETVALIFVAAHPGGYAIFKADGQHEKSGKTINVFQTGDAFWRNGTRSERISQSGMETVIARRILDAKGEWMSEQQELRRREREELEVGYVGRNLATAPIGSVTLGLSVEELRAAVLELLRAGDTIALQHLLTDTRARAAEAIGRDAIESDLGDLLDKLATLAAIALEYEQPDFFARVVQLFAEIYSLPLGPHDDRGFSMSTGISPEEKAPRVFLAVLERIYGLGALAVRLKRWEAVRQLTLQFPERLDDYWRNWLRHGLVMASRAGQLDVVEDARQVSLSLLTLAAQVVQGNPGLTADAPSDDEILTSLARFDFLANLAAIDGAGEVETIKSGVFYPNWARFRQERIQPVADQLVSDPTLRHAIFRNHGDADLAVALQAVSKMASSEAARYDGFWGWENSPVGEFITNNSQ
jgi:hypothetical protein